MWAEKPTDQGLYEAQREHDACGIGAVADILGRRQHAILEYGKQILLNLQHRGAAGADESTGDGAGILFQLPHEFFAEVAKLSGVSDARVGDKGRYAVAMTFLSRDDSAKATGCRKLLEEAVGHYGMAALGWREVPSEDGCLGDLARAAEPRVEQMFIGAGELTGDVFEDRLYLARKRAERMVCERFGEGMGGFHVASMSCQTICYKGMFWPRSYLSIIRI